MSVSPAVPAPVSELWHKAVEHSALAQPELHLLAATGHPLHDADPSVHFQPDQTLVPDEWESMFPIEAIGEANDVANIRRHRIGVRCDCDTSDPLVRAITLGLLRHELEHARQYSGHDRVGQYKLRRLTERIAQSRDGQSSRIHYRLQPTERAANAAAADLVNRECSAIVGTLRGRDDFSPLATPRPAVAPSELPRMTVEYLVEYGTDHDRRKHFGNRSWRALIEDAYPGAGALWDSVTS